MNEIVSTNKPWEEIRGLLESESSIELEAYLKDLSHTELIRSLFRLSDEEQRALLQNVSPDSAAGIVEEMPGTHAAEILEDMPADDAAHIVEAVGSDAKADILAEMDQEDADAILDEMEDEAAADTRKLLEFDSDTAGGLMQTEFFAFPRKHTIQKVLEIMIEREDDYSLYGASYIYVVLQKTKLIGVLRLRDLVFADPTTKLEDIVKDAMTVTPQMSLSDLIKFFEEHDINAVPVVSEDEHILGVVRRRAILLAQSERSEEEHLRQAGIVGGEEFRTMAVTLRSKRRLSWLCVNIILNIMAASVIAMYQDTLTAVIALAVFLPIVSDMSGCSGNQAVAVSLRELSLGVIVPRDLLRVWLQEVKVGLINGLVLGGLIALAAFLWQGNPWLGLVVGAALALNTVIAVSIGGTVPLVLRRFGVDPAIAAGPILTTVTDMCGFALVLGFATLALPLIS